MDPNPQSENVSSSQQLFFRAIPKELLLSIFQKIDIFQNSSILRVCKDWNSFLSSNASLWTSLCIPPRYSFDQSLSILKTFSRRSGNRIERFVLWPEIRNSDRLNQLLEDLRHSANSLRVLFLTRKPRLQEAAQRLFRWFFPKLDTLSMLSGSSIRGMSQREIYLDSCAFIWNATRNADIRHADGRLRILVIDTPTWSGEVDSSWLGQVTALKLSGIDSFQVLQPILKAVESSILDLDLSTLPPLQDVDLPLAGSEAFMSELKILKLPSSRRATEFIRNSIIFKDPATVILDGTLSSLLTFDISGCRRIKIGFVSEELEGFYKEARNPVSSLCRQSEAVEQLELAYNEPDMTGIFSHIIYCLLGFTTAGNGSHPGSETRSKDGHPEGFVPFSKLVDLTIFCPESINLIELYSIYQQRKSIVPDFRLVCRWPEDGDWREVEPFRFQ